MLTLSEQEKKVKNLARSWIEPVARIGYLGKGIVYLMIGVMAMLFAIGQRSRPADFTSVLLKVFSEPFGRLLLALLTIGLIGYGLWCFVQAVMDTEHKGTGFPGIVTRVLYAGIGFVYLAIAWDAVKLLTRTANIQQGDQPERQLTARVFAISPSTRWIAIAAGLGFVGFCIYEIRRLYVEGIEILKPKGRNKSIDDVAMRIGQIGIVARSVLFAIIGIFLVSSGITFDPNKVRGISGALTELDRQPYGNYLLLATALGLAAYGIYMLLLAWRRRINSG
jgi:uncharacterized protein DUF1206